jgi:hypothetical protein
MSRSIIRFIVFAALINAAIAWGMHNGSWWGW